MKHRAVVCNIFLGTFSKHLNWVVVSVCKTASAGNGGRSMDIHTDSFIGRLGRMAAC